jgi:hypothetical protein
MYIRVSLPKRRICPDELHFDCRAARTHAEHAGMSEAVLRQKTRRLFIRRHFFSRISLSPSQWVSWLRVWAMPRSQCGSPLATYITA